MFIALPDRHAVVCLNKEAGKEMWRFTAGSRVDGGLIEYTIDPESGKVLAETPSRSAHPRLLAAQSPYPYAETPTYGYLDFSWTRYATAAGRGGGSAVKEKAGNRARGIGGKMTIGSTDNGFVAFDFPKGNGTNPSMLRTDGKFTWETPIGFPNRGQVEALLLTKNHVLTAGTTDRNKRDKASAFLRVFNSQDGKQSRELTLTAPPVYDGFAAADGPFYLATADGKLTCYGKKK